MKYSTENVTGNGDFACEHFVHTDIARRKDNKRCGLFLNSDNCDKSIANAVKRKDICQFETNLVHIYLLRPKKFIDLNS